MALIVDTPGARRLDYDELKTIPAPQGTATWQPIAHFREEYFDLSELPCPVLFVLILLARFTMR